MNIQGARILVLGGCGLVGLAVCRHLRHRRFWDEGHQIQLGKAVGWILSEEEHGARFKR